MYGKIFESMYEGTLYGQWEAIVTFQQLIVLADQDGFVEMTPPAIAARTSIPLEVIEKGIKVLQEKDPYSRTDGENGKRIILMNPKRPWGWQIVNYKKYRDMASQEDKREYMREYMRKYRVKPCKTELAVLGHTDTDTYTNKDISPTFKFEKKVPLPKNICLTNKMVEYAKRKKWKLDPAIEFERFVTHHKQVGSKFNDWYAAFQKWIQNDIKWHPEHQEPEKEEV